MAIQPRHSSSCVVEDAARVPSATCYLREKLHKKLKSPSSRIDMYSVLHRLYQSSVILSDFCPRPRGYVCLRVARGSRRAAQLLISRTRRANSSSKGWLMFMSLTMSPISARARSAPKSERHLLLEARAAIQDGAHEGIRASSAPTSSSCDADLISGPPTRGSSLPTVGSTPPPPSMSSHSCSGSWMGAVGLGERVRTSAT